jgi:DNA topoisomerase-1
MTMQLAQRLYEGVDIDGSPTALITYMRTDSTNLSGESVAAARKFIQKNYPKYLPDKPKGYRSKSRNAQEAHEAIRPTDPLRTPASLRGKIDLKQWKLYDLIWKQTIACQMTDEVRQRAIFNLQNSRKDEFTGSLAWTTHLGFKAVTEPDLEEKTGVQGLWQEGDRMHLRDIFYIQKFTQPPSRYSPSSLIKKLEELGIGRPSTYATIISTLHDRAYVEDNNKTLIPTTLGMKINGILTENFTQVTSAEMTASMEEDLDEISRGESDYQKVLDDFWWDFKQQVESKQPELKNERQKYRDTETDVRCPKYGDKMVLKMGRFGEYYQNPNHPECMYPKNFREYEAALKKALEEFGHLTKGLKCEECGKDLIVRVSKKSLKAYIACPDYKVGNKHTVKSIKELQGGGSPTDKPKRSFKKRKK